MFPAVDLRAVARRAAAGPARRWRTFPLTAQLMLLGAAMVLAWILTTRAYDRVVPPDRDGRSRVEHWQHAEVAAERLAAAAYEMQGAARSYALTGDTARLREAAAAGARHTALLDSLDQLARVDRDIEMHVAGYRALATGLEQPQTH